MSCLCFFLVSFIVMVLYSQAPGDHGHLIIFQFFCDLLGESSH